MCSMSTTSGRIHLPRAPRKALRVLVCEGAIVTGQLLRDGTAAGLRGRIRGYRAAAGLERRDSGAAPLLEVSAREAIALRRRRRD